LGDDRDEIMVRADERRLEWWRRARFGMFVHWGLISQGGSGDRSDIVRAETSEQRLQAFSAPAFDADAWAGLAAEAGARYLVLVCRHVDGFCLWPSRSSKLTVAVTPLGMDVVAKVAEACRRRGVRFGAYLAIPDSNHPDWPGSAGLSGPTRAGSRMDRYLAYLHSQARELIEGYAPAVLWFDGDNEAPWTHEHGLALHRMCRSLDPDLLINDRVDKGRQGIKIGDGKRPEDFDPASFDPGLFAYFRTPRPPGDYGGDFATPEQYVGLPDRARPWETCMTLGANWTCTLGEPLKSIRELIHILVRCAGGDGNLLLNVGPKEDGSLDPRQTDRMRGIGAWLSSHGSAVYGTRGGPWKPGRYGASTCVGRRVNVLVTERGIEEVALPELPLIVTGCRVDGVPVPHGIVDRCFRVRVRPAKPDEPVRLVELDLDGDAVSLPPLPVTP
jgi:alpha-L-fucosidase